MRIGIDASNISSGGGVTHLRELLGAANPAEHGVENVTVWGSRENLGRLDDRSWLIKNDGGSLEKGLIHRLLWQRLKLPKLARKSCDVLFVPGGNNSGRFRPYVAMSQNILPFDKGERRRYGWSWMRFRLFLLSRGQAKTFREAGGTIFLTEFARGVVEKVTGRLSDAAVIPHGISECFRMEPRRQRAMEGYSAASPFRWLYVSIIDVYKHQWKVARAVSSLAMKGIPVALDLVGPAYQSAYNRLTQEMANLPGCKSYVRYHSAVPHNELAERYKGADGFVFASSCENMPIILLEAMAAGLPIACSNRGPMPEVLRDAGVYFDPESPEDIAMAMKELMLDREKRAECAAKAYEYAKEYTWERCARETFSFLAEVAGMHGVIHGKEAERCAA
jgi:glycosyltransferase involved in cell wall biosynthesis